MDDIIIYGVIGILMAIIGFCAGYIGMNIYYQDRFITVAKECSVADSIVPLIAEMEREA